MCIVRRMPCGQARRASTTHLKNHNILQCESSVHTQNAYVIHCSDCPYIAFLRRTPQYPMGCGGSKAAEVGLQPLPVPPGPAAGSAQTSAWVLSDVVKGLSDPVHETRVAHRRVFK